MSHLEKFVAVIHDIIESAAIGCAAIFHALSFMFNFAAGSGTLDTEARYDHH